MSFEREPSDPLGNGPLEIFLRQIKRWCRGHELLSIIGGRKIPDAGGGYHLVIDKNTSKGGTPSSTGSFRGVHVPGTTYNSQDEVIVQSGPAQGTFVSVIDNNTNDPSTGNGWMQIAPGNTVGMWT